MSRASEPKTKSLASEPRPGAPRRESSLTNLKTPVICAVRRRAVREGALVLVGRTAPVSIARSWSARLTKTGLANGRARSGGALIVLERAKITVLALFAKIISAA